MRRLQKFWFRFEPLPRATAVNIGCGVTAFDREDAFSIIKQCIFGENDPPPILECKNDVSLDDIEQNHARPNVGDLEVRGIWFPQGYGSG